MTLKVSISENRFTILITIDVLFTVISIAIQMKLRIEGLRKCK